MKKIIHASILSFCIIAASAAPVLAEEAKSITINPDEIKKALGLGIYLQGGYTYNKDAGTNGVTGEPEENDLRVFDHKANSFGLDLAQIIFSKDAALGTVGYKLKFSAGETAKFIHSRGLGDATDSFDVTEAFMSYNAAVGKGLKFDFGKFVTMHGAEVIEAKDNPNYSRSFLFNYAIPFTHTGLRMTYAFTDSFSTGLYIVNGWDNTTDNNKAKTYGASVTFAPAEAFTLIVNGMTGPEQDQTFVPAAGSVGSNRRSLVDVVATIKPLKNLSIIVNTDNGREQDVFAAGGSAVWKGVAGIVKYDMNDTYSISVRGETFNDQEGFRTGMAQRLKEVTITPEIRLNGGLILRPEYRHDSSNVSAFDDAAKRSQNTLALGVMYAW
jgi:hypothetical protein